MTATLARLDYRTADAGQAAIASLITSPATAALRLDAGASPGHPATPGSPDGHDAQLVAAATRIVAAAMQAGDHLSQAALAGISGGLLIAARFPKCGHHFSLLFHLAVPSFILRAKADS